MDVIAISQTIKSHSVDKSRLQERLIKLIRNLKIKTIFATFDLIYLTRDSMRLFTQRVKDHRKGLCKYSAYCFSFQG